MFNKTIMLGNLTKDVEMRFSQNGAAVASGSIASNYKYKSNTGEQKDETCFLDFTMFGRSAEIANQYLKKGSKVLLEGRLVLDSWVGNDGVKRSKHSLRVDTMKMLGKDESNSNNSYESYSNQQSNKTSSSNQNVYEPEKIKEIDFSEIEDDKNWPF